MFRRAIGILVILLTPVSAFPQDDKVLLDFILTEQQKTYDSLGKRPYRILVEGTYNYSAPGMIDRTSTYEEIGDGAGNLWGRTVYSGKDGYESKYSLNEKEYSHIPDISHSNAYVVRLAAPGKLDNEARTHFRTDRPRDYLRSGVFVGENATFAEYVKSSLAPTYSWDVVEIQTRDGRRAYDVRRQATYMEVPNAVDADFIIDPDRGYMITSWILRRKNGAIRLYCEMDINEIEPGVHVPSSLRVLGYDETQPGPNVSTEDILRSGIENYSGKLNFANTFQYQSIELDHMSEPDLFTWKGLGVQDPVNVIVTTLDGVTELYLIRDGRLIPRDVAGSLQNTTLMGGTTSLSEEIEGAPSVVAAPKDPPAAVSAGTTKGTSGGAVLATWRFTLIWAGVVAVIIVGADGWLLRYRRRL